MGPAFVHGLVARFTRPKAILRSVMILLSNYCIIAQIILMESFLISNKISLAICKQTYIYLSNIKRGGKVNGKRSFGLFKLGFVHFGSIRSV